MSTRLTVASLKKAATIHNATIEQDDGGRFVVYQACAPFGKVWDETAGKHIRIEWHEAATLQDRQDVLQDAIARINRGVRDMTDQERFECDEENQKNN